MENTNNLDEIIKKYAKRNVHNIYLDNNMDNEGINYQNYIKLRYESINYRDIVDVYTINGWFILWYLMSKAYQTQYIETTINVIAEELKIKAIEVKRTIEYLQKREIIKFTSRNKNYKNNDLLYIAIGYNNDNIYQASNNGYISIPIDFIKSILPTLKANEFAVYCFIMVRYNYYLTGETINKETGELTYYLQRNHYAFPTLEQIGENLDITKDTANACIERLIKNKYNLLTKIKGNHISYIDEEGKQRIKNGNNRYTIPLLKRIEHVYYNIYSIPDNRTKQTIDYINKKGFEDIAYSNEQKILTLKDYINYYFKDLMESYKSCIENKDIDQYKTLRQYKIEE